MGGKYAVLAALGFAGVLLLAAGVRGSGRAPEPRKRAPAIRPVHIRVEVPAQEIAPKRPATADPVPRPRDPRVMRLTDLIRAGREDEAILLMNEWGDRGADLDEVELRALQKACVAGPGAALRYRLLWFLYQLDEEYVRDVTARLLDGETDLQMRLGAIQAAGYLGMTEAIRPALGDSRPEVRSQAAAALATVQPRDPAHEETVLAALLSETDPDARRDMVLLAGSLDDRRVPGLLWQIAADPAEAASVALEAVRALGPETGESREDFVDRLARLRLGLEARRAPKDLIDFVALRMLRPERGQPNLDSVEHLDGPGADPN